ncbi:MAG: peptide chain release factor N(5)-glutamine methyltransferase [Chlorobi bacterium]|nr:peptide chain release factor N(5)-glutamine methyltransferase [Chlorobiota bacterium]
MLWKNNRLSDLKRSYISELASIYGESESKQQLNMLIDYFFGLSRSEQAVRYDFRLSESEMLRMHEAVKDLKRNKPIQYIIGEAEFLDMRIKVNDNVLIPRPETEELIELIAKGEIGPNLNILDIGTGSGCIALALAKNLDNARVSALDISKNALKLADENARINKLEINFVSDDIHNPAIDWGHEFDVIVSNPPYIRRSEEGLMKANVLEYEPHIALFVEDGDPLLFYKAIVGFAAVNLKPGGRLYFEINEALATDVKIMLEENSYNNVGVHKDINGKDRMVSALKA